MRSPSLLNTDFSDEYSRRAMMCPLGVAPHDGAFYLAKALLRHRAGTNAGLAANAGRNRRLPGYLRIMAAS
jgi:hypothetical protein